MRPAPAACERRRFLKRWKFEGMDLNKLWYGVMAISIPINLFFFLFFEEYKQIAGAVGWVLTYVLLILVYRYEYGGRGLG